MMVMPGRSHRGALPPLDARQATLAQELRRDATLLTDVGDRNTGRPASLDRAASVVEAALGAAGLPVARLPFVADGQTVYNLESTVPGDARAGEIVVVGAHYDSILGGPGADDNASGVAAVVALARRFAGEKPARTIRFVAFVNEESPHFWSESMGSLVYAKACKARGDAIVAMLSLETIGYFDEREGSQRYPFVVRPFYPDRGDFIGVVGNLDSRALTRDVVRAFREAVPFPSEGAALPSFVQGVGWSDQWAFWQVGYPAVMVTDTAPFRNPHYHRKTDLPATLDFDKMARVVDGLAGVVRALAFE